MKTFDESAAAGAAARQAELTKPPGSLGRLEELAVFMAGWQGRERPRIDRAQAAAEQEWALLQARELDAEDRALLQQALQGRPRADAARAPHLPHLRRAAAGGHRRVPHLRPRDPHPAVHLDAAAGLGR